MNLSELKNWITVQLKKSNINSINYQEIQSQITKDQINITKQIINLFAESLKYGTNNNTKIKMYYSALELTYTRY